MPGPIWQGGDRGEATLLKRCYESCLQLAEEYGCQTVAFPSISTGIYHFPLDQAAGIAVSTILDWFSKHDLPKTVKMVCFDPRTQKAYETALDAAQKA